MTNYDFANLCACDIDKLDENDEGEGGSLAPSVERLGRWFEQPRHPATGWACKICNGFIPRHAYNAGAPTSKALSQAEARKRLLSSGVAEELPPPGKRS